MEVVYLYIERFMNIEDAHFNFGGKYHFSYGFGEGSDIKNIDLLTDIDENLLRAKQVENPLENGFLGERISNLSLIVGENGSGKTTLLRCLISILRGDFSHGRYLMVYLEGGQYFYIQLGLSDIQRFYVENSSEKVTIEKGDLQSFKFVTYDGIYNPLLYPEDLMFDEYNGQINISTIHLMRRDHELMEIEGSKRKYSNQPYSNVIENFRHKELSRQIYAYSKLKEGTIPFTVPDTLELIPNNLMESWIENGSSPDDSDLRQLQKLQLNESKVKDDNILEYYLFPFFKKAFLNLMIADKSEYASGFKPFEDPKYSEIIATFLKSTKIVPQDIEIVLNKLMRVNTISSTSLNKKFEAVLLFFEKVKEYFTEKEDGKSMIRLDNGDHKSFSLNQLQPIIRLINRDINPDGDYSTNELKSFIESYYSAIQFNGFLDFRWKIKDQTAHLSSGQLNLLNFYSRLLEVNDSTRLDSNLPTLLLLDEPDTTLHPEWQRIFIYGLKEFINNTFDKPSKVQIIIATHSPILTSDVPIQNICYLTMGNKAIPDKETFGANIYELFNNSFFMDQGVIGEFADRFILDLIDRLKNEKSTEDDNRKINLIGDSFLKASINTYLEKINDKIRDR